MSKVPITSFPVETAVPEQIIDITAKVTETLKESDIADGLCSVHVLHTTAGITINENADPDVKSDMLMGLDDIVSRRLNYLHAEGNSTAHIKASLMGSSVVIPLEAGHLVLGTWQGIYFCEFDGPRTRKVHVKVISA